MLNAFNEIRELFSEHARVLAMMDEPRMRVIERTAGLILDAYKKGSCLLVCGNGGSAADAQHMAAELVNRFKREREPFPAISLTTDTSIITSIANDYSYDEIFSKQVKALGKNGDILLAISTSGKAKNVISALNAAKERQMLTIGLTGQLPNEVGSAAQITIEVPSKITARVQEAHILIIHILCELVEKYSFPC